MAETATVGSAARPQSKRTWVMVTDTADKVRVAYRMTERVQVGDKVIPGKFSSMAIDAFGQIFVNPGDPDYVAKCEAMDALCGQERPRRYAFREITEQLAKPVPPAKTEPPKTEAPNTDVPENVPAAPIKKRGRPFGLQNMPAKKDNDQGE
jgi:hypothetical protein